MCYENKSEIKCEKIGNITYKEKKILTLLNNDRKMQNKYIQNISCIIGFYETLRSQISIKTSIIRKKQML